ncbi:MAG: tRNA (N(6)-L-threonylcarbamoyladenosine(37)-C(2))-methylthiotransferase MtaB [Mycoplasma sp.]
MKFAIHTLGCKVNTYESELIRNDLLKNNLKEVNFNDVADLYIINTCTVTNESDVKSRKYIRQAIKKNPQAIICAVGCYTQVANEEVAAIDGVDIILGNHLKGDFYLILQEYLEKYAKNETQLNKVKNILFEKHFEPMLVDYYTDHTRAFVKIQDGCNNFCSYCIIPYSRGGMRSKNAQAIIRECQNLVNKGFYEIVLTGINTGGYGEDLKTYNFANLLTDIENQVIGLKRLRISSIEPTQITEEVLEFIKNSKIIAKHFHIPVQSCSNEVLKPMNRHYTIEEFIKLIEKIRNYIPDVAITTDYITGFPTETEQQHVQSIEKIKEIGFFEMHIFPFSKRRFTPAAKLHDIAEKFKLNRVKELHKLNDELKNSFFVKFVGKTVEIILENKDIIIEGQHYQFGHSSQYLKILIPRSENNKQREFINVKINRVHYPYLIGERIN